MKEEGSINVTAKSLLSKKALKIIICVIFIAIFLLGMIVADDYNIFVDDQAQRNHSLVNYKYINKVILGRDVPELVHFQDLNDYICKNYGTAIQMPMVFIEDLFDFEPPFNIWVMRHRINFIIYFCGLICFYFLCRRLFSPIVNDEKKLSLVSLAGVLMMFLFPRFFSASFFNIKDLVFSSLFIISLHFMIMFLKNGRKTTTTIIFCILCALATNSRMVGLLLIPSVLVFMLIEDIAARKKEYATIMDADSSVWPKTKILNKFRPYILILIVFSFVFFAITPAMWEDPINQFSLMLQRTIDFDLWDNVMLFDGSYITRDEMPWYYLPVWMFITIPVYILFFWVIGMFDLVKRTIHGGTEEFLKQRFYWLILLLLIIPVSFQMIGMVRIYIDWHHVYFLFVPIQLLAVYGAIRLNDIIQKKSSLRLVQTIVPLIVVAGLVVSGARIVWNHPHQEAMFNAIGTPFGNSFDHSAPNSVYITIARYLLDNYPEGEIHIISRPALEDALRIVGGSADDIERIHILNPEEKNLEQADFYLRNYRPEGLFTYELPPSFTETYTIWVDRTIRVASLFANNDSPLHGGNRQ